MSTPNKDNLPIDNGLLESIGKAIFGRSCIECIKKDICINCGKPVLPEKTPTEHYKYYLSIGLCFKCSQSVYDV